jgi:SpoVK/Ycf46/Vps4 family AAA+-type ATPase
VVDFRLPGEEELARVFDFLSRGLADSHPQGAAHCPDDLRSRVIQALKGLTATEAENALSMALYRHGGFAPEMLETLEQHKAAAIRKSEVLTYLPKERIATEEEIGGYEELLDFIRMRAVAYSPEARRVDLDLPKGIVLLGVPGTGKSMVGKAVARLLKLPLALFDVASVFASLVGESERRMRTALATVEALDGCVLLLDEADKAVGGAHEARGDAGVTRRVFGQLLTWLAEKQDRTFVVATLNRIEGMPPEFLRKGRFDEVFYADLPEPDERRQILAIHLHKRGIDPQRYGEEEWRQLVEATKDFVGSELEELVKAARFLAFEHRKEATPTAEELLESARATNPIAKLEAENVRAIRDFCRKRARPVSGRRDVGDRRRERHVARVPVASAAAAESGDGSAMPAGAAGWRQR